jgi:hypothetical protein
MLRCIAGHSPRPAADRVGVVGLPARRAVTAGRLAPSTFSPTFLNTKSKVRRIAREHSRQSASLGACMPSLNSWYRRLSGITLPGRSLAGTWSDAIRSPSSATVCSRARFTRSSASWSCAVAASSTRLRSNSLVQGELLLGQCLPPAPWAGRYSRGATAMSAGARVGGRRGKLPLRRNSSRFPR